MKIHFPPSFLMSFSDTLAARSGLYYPPERWADLECRLNRVVAEMACLDMETCMRNLSAAVHAQDGIGMLADYLTVGETYFFREPQVLAVLEKQVLAALIARKDQSKSRHLRIWSAGCCTGEEPYTLVILLDRLLPGFSGWDITVLASDLNSRFLEKAKQGIYSAWSLRATPEPVRHQYFNCVGKNAFGICQRIREKVEFSSLNLAEDNYPSSFNNTNAMDIIVCRNVLMYFKPEIAQQVLNRFHACLVPEGCLILGQVEAASLNVAPFVAMDADGVILIKKTQRSEPDVPDALPSSDRTIGPERMPQLPQLPQPSTSLARSVSDDVPGTMTAGQNPDMDTERVRQWIIDGEYGRAIERIEAWRKVHPDHPESLLMLARIYANQGRQEQALACCEQASALNKLAPEAHYLHALIQQEQGKPDLAMRSLRRTLYLNPGHVLAHYTLGVLARQQGNDEHAARHFRHALDKLRDFAPDQTVPDSEGLTAARLTELIHSQLV